MRKMTLFFLLFITILGFAQTNEWFCQYATFDDDVNGTGYQTSSVATVGPNCFVALVISTPSSPTDIFNPSYNYLVGYWNADSGNGRVPSPINGQQTVPQYATSGQFTSWTYILDQVVLKGAWQLAGEPNGRVYVANNDPAHNILVFELTASGVTSTEYRMETGMENIYGIEVDTNGYVYVVDFEGSNSKTGEVKVYAGIDAPGTTWGVFGAHNDPPITTIDLPPGIYQGITINGDGSAIFISATSERRILKFVGSPTTGYTQDIGFNFVLSPDDTVGSGGSGTPSVLGMAFIPDPPLVCVAVDTFVHIGNSGGYPYGRMYFFHPGAGIPFDTIDVAAWNYALTGSYSTGSNNGRCGGFTSIVDVDVEPTEPAVYSQTFYGWAVEKWVFDGDLGSVVNVRKINNQVPQAFALKQNYPNPFNPITSIEFQIDQNEQVVLEIFNVRGQKVSTLINQKMQAGTYLVSFDASSLPAGVYFYRLTAGSLSDIKKMTLVK